MLHQMQVVAKVRKVGNSLSIVIPAKKARVEKIAEGDIVQIEIQKKVNVLGPLWLVKIQQEQPKSKGRSKVWLGRVNLF